MVYDFIKPKLKWLLPLFLIVLITPFSPRCDLYCARIFYSIEEGLFYNPLPFRILYKYGEIFGFVIGAASLFLLFLSYQREKIKPYRKALIAFVLTLVLGAGLITNVLFKGYWGRPRPKQLTEFGGNYEYRPFYKPNFCPHESQKSFPSGHAAMGFCYLSFCFSFRRLGKKGLYYTAVLLTLVSGCGLMIARVAQGGHFFSDVTFSLALMWTLALLLDKILFREAKEAH